METLKTFPLKLTPTQHATIKRRAEAAELPMYKYIIEITTTGKINATKKK